MNKKTKAEQMLKQPYYEGGNKALSNFIASQLKYPESVTALNIVGSVHLKYDINFKGEVVDVKVIKGLDIDCNEEAVRVVKLLKFVVPKTPRGLKVLFHKTINIHFKPQTPKNQKIEVHTPTSTNYTYTTTSHDQNNAAKKVNYTYSIILPKNNIE